MYEKQLLAIMFLWGAQATQTIAEEATVFELGTFEPHKLEYFEPVAPIKSEPMIDAEDLYRRVLRCYPSRSRFENLSVKVVGSYAKNAGEALGIRDSGDYYFGLVAEMPLIDNSETIERQRTREYNRRNTTAKQIADFISAISERNHANRQLGLFAGLELRSQVRVRAGITSVSEQVDHLKTVIDARHTLTKAEAKITRARLALSGQCASNRINAMDTYLKHLAR